MKGGFVVLLALFNFPKGQEELNPFSVIYCSRNACLIYMVSVVQLEFISSALFLQNGISIQDMGKREERDSITRGFG